VADAAVRAATASATWEQLVESIAQRDLDPITAAGRLLDG
jgi:hypothetical protein